VASVLVLVSVLLSSTNRGNPGNAIRGGGDGGGWAGLRPCWAAFASGRRCLRGPPEESIPATVELPPGSGGRSEGASVMELGRMLRTERAERGHQPTTPNKGVPRLKLGLRSASSRAKPGVWQRKGVARHKKRQRSSLGQGPKAVWRGPTRPQREASASSFVGNQCNTNLPRRLQQRAAPSRRRRWTAPGTRLGPQTAPAPRWRKKEGRRRQTPTSPA